MQIPYNLVSASKVLGITRERVRQIAVHRGIGVHVGHHWYFSPEDLERIKAERGKWVGVNKRIETGA